MEGNSNFTFLFVGQLIKRKGIDWLIKAFKIVKKNNKKILINNCRRWTT